MDDENCGKLVGTGSDGASANIASFPGAEKGEEKRNAWCLLSAHAR